MTDINYDRPKVTTINDTAMTIHWEAAEGPTAETDIDAGTNGIMTFTLVADADESGGADLQDLFTGTNTPAIDQTTGRITLVVVLTPVDGDASDMPAVTLDTVTHPQTMDAWQSAAGRARQA